MELVVSVLHEHCQPQALPGVLFALVVFALQAEQLLNFQADEEGCLAEEQFPAVIFTHLQFLNIFHFPAVDASMGDFQVVGVDEEEHQMRNPTVQFSRHLVLELLEVVLDVGFVGLDHLQNVLEVPFEDSQINEIVL